MNKKSKKITILLIVFLCIITTSFIYGKYAHTIRKTINLNISKPTYSVVFHSNNGSNNTRTQSFVYGTGQALYANNFTKTGEYFAGWNTEANGTGTSYVDKQFVNNLTSTNNATIHLYAQWSAGKAYSNGIYYPTLRAAVLAAPTDDTLTLVTLLTNTSEIIDVAAGQNVELDLQNFTITNSGGNPIIENRGKLKITNGNFETSATQGAINVYSGAELEMTGGSIVATGTKQAIYINGGTATIGGTTYLSNTAGDRAALHCINAGSLTITGGTIISENYFAVKTENTCALVVGEQDGTSHHDSPVFQGSQYGIYNASSVNVKFYDGISKGTSRGIYAENRIGEKETGYTVKKSSEIIDGVQYGTYYLFKAVTITFDGRGGSLSSSSKSIGEGDAIGLMPVPAKSNYIFDGWYTTGGDLVTEDTVFYADETIHAEYISRNSIYVAEYNGVQYHSFQAAVNQVPNDGTPSTITLLMDTREHVTINSGQNIVLDTQGYKLRNDGNKTIFENYGTLSISEGEISSGENYAIIDNYDTGRIYVTGGSIISLGTRQAIYNNGGYVEISGDAYLSSCASGRPTNSNMDRATIQNLVGSTLLITGGTIIGVNNQAISNEATLTIGIKDGLINPNSPVIQGNTYAIKSDSVVNFYDGILKGITGTYDGTITDYETDSVEITGTEVIDYKTYNTVYLNITT